VAIDRDRNIAVKPWTWTCGPQAAGVVHVSHSPHRGNPEDAWDARLQSFPRVVVLNGHGFSDPGLPDFDGGAGVLRPAQGGAGAREAQPRRPQQFHPANTGLLQLVPRQAENKPSVSNVHPRLHRRAQARKATLMWSRATEVSKRPGCHRFAQW